MDRSRKMSCGAVFWLGTVVAASCSPGVPAPNGHSEGVVSSSGDVQPTYGHATTNESSSLPIPIDVSTLDELIPALRQNESVVRSYSGRMRQTVYTFLSRDKDDVYMYKGTDDPFVDVFESEFVYDRSRGHDYHVHIHHVSSPNPVSRPYIEERRYGTEVETLVMDPEKRPVLGLIKRLGQAANLGRAPRNMDTRSEIFVGASSEEQGYLRRPLSELLDNNDHVWLYPGEFEVAGQPCMKIAVQFEGPVRGRVAFVWLNKNANLCIQKQLTVNPHGDFIRDLTGSLRPLGWSAQDYLNYLATITPATLVVNEEYTELAPGLWIPQKSTAYGLSYLIPKEAMQQELQSPEDYERIRRLKDNFPATADLKNIIVRGYHVFELDMNSLRVNESVDASIFEESIIPDGVPVTDFVRNVHSEGESGNLEALEKSTNTSPQSTNNDNQ